MGNYDDIGTPVQGQPVSSGAFGIKVRNYLINADARISAIEGNQQLVIKRGRRITSTGNVTTTETGVLRIDNIPVLAGRLYQISTGPINMDGSVDNDVGRVGIRTSQSGAATTSSTLSGYMRLTIDNNSQSNVVNANAWYLAPSDGMLSVLLTLVRQAGTGNIIIFGSASDILDLVVQFAGNDPGDSGVVI